MPVAMRLPCILILVLLGSFPSLGCQMVMNRATSSLAGNLTTAVLDQNDYGLVRDGAPAFLIMVDGLIQGSPENETLLLAGANLYGSYATGFVDEKERAVRLSLRGRAYGKRALCKRKEALCSAVSGPFDNFVLELQDTGKKDLPVLYGFGSVWASWIQTDSGDWNAIADLPKVQSLMERVVALDDSYEDGGAHLYLGVLYSLRPASLGGKPELAREHFERAVELSEGKNLMAKVLFASQYARLVFDRPLHDRLLTEVLDADPDATGYTLTNTLAQEEASELLAESDEYF
jgi:hypothetical protein